MERRAEIGLEDLSNLKLTDYLPASSSETHLNIAARNENRLMHLKLLFCTA